MTDYILGLAGGPRACASVMNQHSILNAIPDLANHQLGVPQHVVFCLDNVPTRQVVIGHCSEGGGMLAKCREVGASGAATLQLVVQASLHHTQRLLGSVERNAGS